jgi:hypothetical protein
MTNIQSLHDCIERLKKLSRHTGTICKLLSAYLESAADPVANAYVMEKQARDIEKRIHELPDSDIRTELQKLFIREQEHIVENKQEFKIRFGQQLQALFKEHDLAIKGQYPLLRVGFYTIKLDFEFGQAALFFGPEIDVIISRIALHPKTVFDSVIQYDRKLRALDHSPQEYLHSLYLAYSKILRIHDKKLGEKMLLSDILKEFVISQQSKTFFVDPQKSHFKEYSRVKLAFILYQIKQAGTAEHGLHFHVATFDATTDKLQSLWIPENEYGEGTHYSHISFDKKCDQSAP